MFVSAGCHLKFHNWPLEGNQEIFYKPLGLDNVVSLSWSKDNSFLTFVTENGIPEIISLKDPENIRNVHTISAVAGASAIAFQRTTKRCIGIATNSGQVALYDTKSKCICKLLQAAPCRVNLLDFNFGDAQMAVSCVNGSILLYDLKHGSTRETYIAPSTLSPTAMTYHPSEKNVLAIGVADGTVQQWDTNVGVTKFSAQLHSKSINGLVLLENSDLMLSVGSDHKFCIHNLNCECIFSSNQQHPLTAVDVSSDGLNITVGSETGHISVYDIRKLIKPLIIWKAHNSKINKLLFERKVKYDFHDICEEHLITFQSNQDIPANNGNNFGIQNFGKIQPTPYLNEPCEVKCRLEKQYKSLPETSQLTSDRKNQNDTITMKSIKQEVADTINKSANEIRIHLMAQFGSLQNFVANEFRTINRQMEDKWDILNIPKKRSSRDMLHASKQLLE